MNSLVLYLKTAAVYSGGCKNLDEAKSVQPQLQAGNGFFACGQPPCLAS
jgi:hypothetical protein